MNIILTNGAPFSGKDTFVKQLLNHIDDSVFIRFKNPLYSRFSKRHNLDLDTVIDICTGPQKDQPCALIGGLIPRAELIDISENEIKVEMGADGVAELVLDEILDTEEHGRKTFIFPDSGFPNELALFKRVLKRYGLQTITIIRIVRDGCEFAKQNDSRGYLENPDLIIDNNADESHLPEDQRGQHMLEQYFSWLKTK